RGQASRARPQGFFANVRMCARTAVISASVSTPCQRGIAPLPLWIVSRSCASVREFMYAASWKLRGGGLRPLAPGPSPWPSRPWQSAQRVANTWAPRSAALTGEPLEPPAPGALGGALAVVSAGGVAAGVEVAEDELEPSEPFAEPFLEPLQPAA